MIDKIYTTLSQIRDYIPYEYGYKKLVKSLGGIEEYGKDTPVSFRQIYDINDYNDMLWCIRTIDEKWQPLVRHFSCDCADAVKHLMIDKKAHDVIGLARLFADGKIDNIQLATSISTFEQDSATPVWWCASENAGDAAWGAARDAAWLAARENIKKTTGSISWGADMIAALHDAEYDQIKHWFVYCKTGKRVIKKISLNNS